MIRAKWVVAILAFTTNAGAQWLDYVGPGIPRTREGKVNVSAPAPRAANGKPDLSGAWETVPPPPGENQRIFGPAFGQTSVPGDDAATLSKYFINLLIDFKPGESPILPAAEALFNQHRQNATENPSTNCLPQ